MLNVWGKAKKHSIVQGLMSDDFSLVNSCENTTPFNCIETFVNMHIALKVVLEMKYFIT